MDGSTVMRNLEEQIFGSCSTWRYLAEYKYKIQIQNVLFWLFL